MGEAKIEFESKILSGFVKYTVQRNDAKTNRLCLDTNNLNIYSVTDTNGAKISYKLHPISKPHLGQLLEITLPPDTTVISIQYSTNPQSSALQWLPPSQTAGKVRPFLFTQCQAIHARSLFPCQDRPGVKFCYTARITCPSWSTCVMSALLQKTE